MAEEKAPEPAESSEAKKPIIKIALVGVGIVVLIAGAVAGTLFLTGALSHHPAPEEEAGEETEAAPAKDKHGGESGHGEQSGHGAPAKKEGSSGEHGGKESGGHGKPDAKSGAGKSDGPQKRPLPSGAESRFEKTYMELDDKKALVANVSGSRKVMQVSLSLMTQYDDRVFKNVDKHRAALRSVALDVLRQTTEPDLTRPDFRAELAGRLRDRINVELERLEGFGGIEEVFFTEFVYQ